MYDISEQEIEEEVRRLEDEISRSSSGEHSSVSGDTLRRIARLNIETRLGVKLQDCGALSPSLPVRTDGMCEEVESSSSPSRKGFSTCSIEDMMGQDHGAPPPGFHGNTGAVDFSNPLPACTWIG